MTRRQQLLAGTVALCLVIMAAGYFLLAQPRKTEVKDLRDQSAAQKSTNTSTRAQVASLQAIQAQLPAQRRRVDALTAKVPADPALTPLIRQLSEAATASNVTLAGITPTRPAAIDGAAGLSGLQLSLNVTGDYVSLEQFQIKLEGLQRSFLVSQITFAENAAAAGTASSSASGGISATIVGRVLTGTAGVGGTGGASAGSSGNSAGPVENPPGTTTS